MLGLAAILVLVGAATVLADTNPITADNPTADGVTAGVDTKENGFAVSSGIPIASSRANALSSAKVVYSVPVAGLDPSELLHFVASVSISRCNDADTEQGNGPGEGALRSPCENLGRGGNTYPYDPQIEARVYRASDQSEIGHDAGSTVLDDATDTCSEFQHHCPLDLHVSQSAFAINANKPYFNVEAFAWTGDNRRQSGDVVELEGDCLNHDYDPPGAGFCEPLPQDPTDSQKPAHDTKGQLGVTREGGSHPPANTTSSSTINEKQIVVNGGGSVVYTKAVQHLDPGDVIETDTSNLHVKNDGDANGNRYTFEHDVTAWWILTGSASDITPSTGGRWISGKNGKNCRNDTDGCLIRQLGTVTVPDAVAPNSTLRVNLIIQAKDAGAPAGTWYAKVLGMSPNTPSFVVRCYSVPRGTSGVPACNS